jgi:uncharacterized membrane protein YhhN
LRRSTTLTYALVAGADAALAAAGRPVPRRASKPLLMPLLMVGRDRPTRLALALSWIGDVALLSSRPVAFRVGLGAFLGGHLAWIATLNRRRRTAGRPSILRQPPVLAAPYVLAAAVLTAYLAPRAGRDRLPVIAYAAVLTEMALAAVDTGEPAATAGGALFMASDTLLALDRFAGMRVPRHDGWAMATYSLAQLLLAADGNARRAI